MNIPHEAVSGPSAWQGSALGPVDWSLNVDSRVLDAFDRTLRTLSERQRRVDDLGVDEFHNPDTLAFAAVVASRLREGLGFVVLRGWHERGWSEAQQAMALWGLGTLLGAPRVQNVRGERISVVAKAPVAPDGTPATGDSTVSKGDDEVRPHTEKGRLPQVPRLISLLCLQAAEVGGETILLSGHSIHNRILAARPEVMGRLFDNFPFGRHPGSYADGLQVDWAPVFKQSNSKLLVRYNRPWVRVAEDSLGRPLDEAGRSALDAFEELLEDEDLRLTLRLEPGDLLIADNHVVLHARAKFQDSPGEAKRRLLRLWVD